MQHNSQLFGEATVIETLYDDDDTVVAEFKSTLMICAIGLLYE